MEEEKTIEQRLKEAEEALLKCTAERDEYLDGWKRAKADYANYKREESERFASWGKMANESLVADLLLVLDSLNVGLSMVSGETAESRGMSLIKVQLEDVLRRYGLEKIEAPPGKEFDPSREEAVGEEESDFPEGSVAVELEKGYALGGRILRPAKIKVSKSKK